MTPFKSFEQRQRGTTTGTVYTNPAGSNKIAFVSVNTDPLNGFDSEGGGRTGVRTGSIVIGGRTVNLNFSNLNRETTGPVIPAMAYGGLVLPGESLVITSSVGVNWEIVELNMQTA